MISIINCILMITVTKTLSLGSPAFKQGETIPTKFTCEGDNINPALHIGNVPKEAKSLVLIVEDPDAVKGTFDHWIMWNIPTEDNIPENSAPGVQGKNGAGQNSYTGPCPPTGTHRYYFRMYALDTKLDLDSSADKTKLQQAMKGHVLATGELMGLYKKVK